MFSENQLMKLYSAILKGDEDAIQFLLSLADPRRSYDERVRSDFAGEIWKRLLHLSELRAQSVTALHELITEARYSLKALRKHDHLPAHAKSLPLGHIDGSFIELRDHPSEAPPSQALLRELIEAVRTAVNSLPETQQYVWYCYYERKLPVSRIAEIGRLREKNLTLDMVKSRLKRARKYVKSRLVNLGITPNG